MGSMLLVVAYACAAAFLASVIHRFVKISRLPMHLRWELYPVAHEKGKADYGGSYLEESDWWTKPRESSKLGELKVMIPEILLLAGVWEHNRSQWFRSFPFHFGVYMLAGLVGLLLLGGIASATGASVTPDGGLVWSAVYHLTYVVGFVGLALCLIGSLALLARRMFDVDYAEYTKRGDYFNLAFFVITVLVALGAHALGDTDFAGLRGYVSQLVTFDFAAANAGDTTLLSLPGLEIVLGCLLFAYIPMTHMSHFFTKWFMYHDIRWSDEPNFRGSKIEKKIQEALQYPVSWSAPHIRGDGKKNWVDVATSGVEE